MPESCNAYRHAQIVVRAPYSRATLNRYKSLIKMYQEILSEMSIDPTHLDTSGSRNQSADPIAAAKELIMRRCGPKSAGYDGLSAASTGVAIKSSVIAFWKSMGHSTHYSVKVLNLETRELHLKLRIL